MNPDLAAALVADSRDNPSRVVDFLLEHEVPLRDVLLLFAGDPPDWAGGLAQECLAEWLARQEPADERAGKVATARVLSGHFDVWWRHPGGNHVRGAPFMTHCPFGQPEIGQLHRRHDEYEAWGTEAAARRHLKRRVLSLFGEVTARRTLSLPHETTRRWHWQAAMAEAGFRMYLPYDREDDMTGRTTTFAQTLAAPNWVPPHEEERARLRAMQNLARIEEMAIVPSPDTSAIRAFIADCDRRIAEAATPDGWDSPERLALARRRYRDVYGQDPPQT